MNLKNIIPLIAALCFLMPTAIAQNTPNNNDALFENTSRDRLIIELGHGNLGNKPVGMNIRWFSRVINVYLMYDIAISKNENFSFAPGIGLGTNVYVHNTVFGQNDDGITFFEEIPDAIDYTRNNLSTNFVDIPLEFRFRTNPDKFGKRFKIAAGFKGGYLINGHTKWVGNIYGDVPLNDYKNRNIPNLNNIRYGYTLRIGYSNFNIIGFYSAAPLFQIGQSTVNGGIKPFYIGFSFNSL